MNRIQYKYLNTCTYIDITMATKSITITCEAYERLSTYKEPKESFSDVINKLTNKGSLLDLVGILSNKEAKELRESVKETRRQIQERVEETAKRIK